MANTENTNNFDPSIYNIQETINEISKRYVPDESEDTLALGLFGYIQDVASLQIQNDIIINSELGNELWPSRAKYEKNVIAHSIIQNITDINATPAVLQILIGLDENKLDGLFINDIFTIDKDYTFMIGNFEFHLEYDIKLQRTYMPNAEQYIYSARYDIVRNNNLSSITNPYTNTPYIQLENGNRTIYIPCQIMQVSHITEYRKIITSSSVDNKTFEFSFEDQLADFEVCVIESDKTTYLTPIFDGSPVDNDVENYCYYTYIDSNTIRVRFDSLSYLPTLNADVEVYIKTTKGEEGNFERDTSQYLQLSLSSETYNYKNFTIYLRTGEASKGGEDRKSVQELRRLLPKEALSRGSITTTQDLQNFFNTMVLDSSKVKTKIMKKINNDFEKRSYYAYLVMKDEYENIVPTNTISIEVPYSSFDTHENRKYVLKPGCKIVYENGIGHIYNDDSSKLQSLLEDDTRNLIYTIPFMLVVTAQPLYISYYLAVMNYPVYLTFDYINQKSNIQFICSYITWTRKFLSDNDTYFLDMSLTENLNTGSNLLTFDKNGEIIDSKLKVIMVMYNDDITEPYRYAIGEVVGKDSQYHVQFKLKTSDLINDDNKIRIENVYVPKSTAKDYGYFTGHISTSLYVLLKSENDDIDYYGLDNIVPVDYLDGWTVTNMYTVNGGLNFYYNYSQVMSSLVKDTTVLNEYGDETGFLISSVPVVKYSYMNDEHNIQEFINQINYEKAYIDNATELLENNFLIDFKLFNTYGKSTLYTIDRNGTEIVDRIHLTLNFEVKLLKTSDNNTKDYIVQDIKTMIEDLNSEDSLHIPNLITTITNTYRNSIEYIEFLGFNDYGPGIQHLYKQESEDITAVPEFITINVNDLEPDINIKLV